MQMTNLELSEKLKELGEKLITAGRKLELDLGEAASELGYDVHEELEKLLGEEL